jgi:hypothetical protein
MLAVPKLITYLIMKNLKRIFLLLALAFIASKVLFSDFDLSQKKNLNPIASIASK